MAANSINAPLPIITDIDGQPLEGGYIWIGTAGLDPQTNPQNAYWDSALTALVTQPARTIGGYPMRAGAPGRLFTNGDYSIRVQNKNGTALFSNLYASSLSTANQITYVAPDGLSYLLSDLADDTSVLKGDAFVAVKQPYGGAVKRTQHDKNKEFISVRDFGAVGNGVTSDTAAVQLAIDTGLDIFFPPGTYVCGALTVSTDKQFLFSDGNATIKAINGTIQQITVQGDSQGFINLIFYGLATADNAVLYAAIYTGVTPATNLTVSSCWFTGNATYGHNNGIKLTINCHGAIITHNRFDNMWGSVNSGYCILASDTNYCLIADNIMIGNSATKTRGRHGVYLSASAKYNIVKGNYIDGMYEAGITLFSTGAQNPCEYNIVQSNIIRNCSRVANLSGGGITIGGKSAHNMCIHNMVLDSPAKGITFDSTGFGTSAVPVATGNIISGNKVYNSGTLGITMINNDNFIISNNDIKDSSTGFVGVYPHIGFDNVAGGFACQNGLITGNKCNVSTTARSSLQFNAAFAATGITVWGNKFPACVTTDIELNISVVPINGLIWSVSSWDPANIAAGASTNTSVTVAGAATSDLVQATLRGAEMVAGMFLFAYVSAPDTVIVSLGNLTAGAVDIANTVLTIAVRKRIQ